MNKLKVCHFTSVHKPDDIRIFHKECSSLAEAGYDVSLVAVNTKDQRINDVQIVNVTSNPTGRINRMLTTTKLVYEKALSLDADIYHFHDPELLRFGLKLKRKGKIVIYDAHEDVPKQILDKHWIPSIFRGLISKMMSSYEAYVAKRIDAVVSVNKPICERFKKHNEHVSMIANYPLFNEINALNNSEIKKEKAQLCYVGGLFPTRGIKQMVEALEFVDATLVLAGNFSTKEFEEEVKNLPGWKKVNYLGHVDRSQILGILSSSTIGMVTLLPTASYVESLPIKLFEYMASGLPTIASNFDLWIDMIEKDNCGICVDPKDPKAIANAVKKILDNPELAEQMAVNGRKAVTEKYNWDQEKIKLISLYKELI